MKTCLTIATVILATSFASIAPVSAQQHGAAVEIKKLNPAVISTPDFQYTGDKRRSELGKWLEIECDFVSNSEVPVPELTFKFYALLNTVDKAQPLKLYVGEVTYVNIPKGENHAVMYIAPGTLNVATGGRGLTTSSIENIAVEISQQGATLSSISLKEQRNQAMWWSKYPQVPGLVVNKNQTPFAPLYWDRYPEIKSQAR